MATNPKNRSLTVSYPGGTVSAARGLLEYFLEISDLTWQPVGIPGQGRRRKYGTKQRSQSKGGRVHLLKLDDDKFYSVRVTGTTQRFVDQIVTKSKPGKVLEVYTQSGTKMARQFSSVS